MRSKAFIFLFFLFLTAIVLSFFVVFSRQKILVADFESVTPSDEASAWREFGGKLTIGQTIFAPSSQKLAMIRVYIRNPQSASSSTPISLFIRERPEDKDYLAKSSQTLEALQEGKYLDFVITPEFPLTSQKLYFYLEAPELPKEKYLQARTEPEARSYPEGNLYWNHKEKSADLIFALYHKESKLQYYLGKFWQKNAKRIPSGGRGIIWLGAMVILIYSLVKIIFSKKIQSASRAF